MKSLPVLVSETLQDDPVQEKYIHIYEKCHGNLMMQYHSGCIPYCIWSQNPSQSTNIPREFGMGVPNRRVCQIP